MKYHTHGLSGTRFNHIFKGMRARCNNPHVPCYKRYGKLGIKCLWDHFIDFKNDMYKSYIDHVEKFGEIDTTIERVNPSGNYSKENCRWATKREQDYNRRNSVFIEFEGIRLSLPQWADQTGIPAKELWKRFVYRKWSAKKTLLQPIRVRHRTAS